MNKETSIDPWNQEKLQPWYKSSECIQKIIMDNNHLLDDFDKSIYEKLAMLTYTTIRLLDYQLPPEHKEECKNQMNDALREFLPIALHFWRKIKSTPSFGVFQHAFMTMGVIVENINNSL
jgi:hypothetical protein